jgi:hypothetical protein
MKKLIPLCLLALLATACGGGNADNTRAVEQQRRTHDIVPMEATDEALNTEADMAMRTIFASLKQKAVVSGGDPSSFYNSISGRMNDAKLQKLGLTRANLTGTWYKPEDYSLSFSGKQLTITAGSPGTRGYKTAKYTVP